MSEAFKFEAEDGKPAASDKCCGVCPLVMMPEKARRALLRPPFRKRHPVIWWACVCAIAVLAFAAYKRIAVGESGVERIALVRVAGPILDPAPTLAWIWQLENNPDVKGVLARVDSPGGGAAASQEIYAALNRLAQKMPVAVSMGAAAASGGLMISMAGQRVFANPSTVTGSIGVRMDIPQLQGLMSKIGVGQETLVTAPYKDAASYTHPLTPEDRAYLENVLMNMHDQFVEIVAKGRRMPLEKAKALANGKIYTGQEALELGLIDALGGQDDARIWLAGKTGVPAERKLLERPVSRTRALERLLSFARIIGLGLEEGADLEKVLSGWAQPAFLY